MTLYGYDLILGCDVLSQLKININFNNKLISGPDSRTVQLHHFPNAANLSPTDIGICLAMDHFETSIIDSMMMTNDDIRTTPLSDPPIALPVDLNSSDPTTPSPLKKKQKKNILPSLYETHDPKQIVEGCVHLGSNQQQLLMGLLSKFPTLFNGKIKVNILPSLYETHDPKQIVEGCVHLGSNQQQLLMGLLSKFQPYSMVNLKYILTINFILTLTPLSNPLSLMLIPFPRSNCILSNKNSTDLSTLASCKSKAGPCG